MKSWQHWFIALVFGLAFGPALSPVLRADVDVVNDSGETLFVATGQLVGGRIVYYGWTRVEHNNRVQVYGGNAPRIMLAVVSIRNGAPHAWRISNHMGAGELMVAADDFRCEQLGGFIPQWRMNNLGQGSVWVHDEDNPWPIDMNLFSTTFYVVSGNMSQRFIP